jgi:hypothetical protein
MAGHPLEFPGLIIVGANGPLPFDPVQALAVSTAARRTIAGACAQRQAELGCVAF